MKLLYKWWPLALVPSKSKILGPKNHRITSWSCQIWWTHLGSFHVSTQGCIMPPNQGHQQPQKKYIPPTAWRFEAIDLWDLWKPSPSKGPLVTKTNPLVSVNPPAEEGAANHCKNHPCELANSFGTPANMVNLNPSAKKKTAYGDATSPNPVNQNVPQTMLKSGCWNPGSRFSAQSSPKE